MMEVELSDLSRLADYYQNNPPNSWAKLQNVLVKIIRSRDPADRLAACHLFVRCGSFAKTHLRRAVKDADELVADAAQDALDQLGG